MPLNDDNNNDTPPVSSSVGAEPPQLPLLQQVPFQPQWMMQQQQAQMQWMMMQQQQAQMQAQMQMQWMMQQQALMQCMMPSYPLVTPAETSPSQEPNSETKEEEVIKPIARHGNTAGILNSLKRAPSDEQLPAFERAAKKPKLGKEREDEKINEVYRRSEDLVQLYITAVESLDAGRTKKSDEYSDQFYSAFDECKKSPHKQEIQQEVFYKLGCYEYKRDNVKIAENFFKKVEDQFENPMIHYYKGVFNRGSREQRFLSYKTCHEKLQELIENTTEPKKLKRLHKNLEKVSEVLSDNTDESAKQTRSRAALNF